MQLRFANKASEAHGFSLTVGQLLNGVAARAGDQLIVYRDQRQVTYREWIGRIGRLASLLTDAGATPGMTVAVMDWDSHRYLEAYFAVPMLGAVLQTVNVRMPDEQIAYTLAHAEAEILIVHRDFFPIVASILPELPRIRQVIAIMDDAPGDLPDWAIGEYEALSAAANPDFPFQTFDENAIATTFYTTGTTGNPKGVCFSHRQLVLHSLVTAGTFGASAAAPALGVGDVYMPLTPMFHVHAWGMPYVAAMLGIKQVYPGRYDPDTICRLRETHGVNYSHCVPTILEMLLQGADQRGTDLSGWKMTIGGAALSQALCARAQASGMIVAAGYGMSETCPLLSRAGIRGAQDRGDDETMLANLTAAGIPAPLVDARIVDDAMSPLPHDGETRGELVVRAPWLTPCYIGDTQSSDALWRGGWLHTQDIATIDAQGRLRIRDRLKDVIKTGGEWIDSIALEELVATAPGVAEAAVIAMPDARWGERPLAVIVCQPGATATLDTLNAPVDAAIAAGTLTRYARLGQFETVDRLPRTSVGKIDKKLLRARFAAPAPD